MTYDFKCPSCQQVKRNVRVRYKKPQNGKLEDVMCKQCMIPMKRLFSNYAVPHLFPHGGLHLQNVSAEGRTFHSKKEMQRYAKKNDLELGALL